MNRDAPRLYLRNIPHIDDFWWELMQREGTWLAGRGSSSADTVEELLVEFAAFYRGAVVWDERVPATSNLASTLAGVERLLVLRYDPRPGSLYHDLVVDRRLLEVRTRLLNDDGSPMFTGQGTIPGTSRASSGSAKCDAYLWAVEHLVRTGRVNAHKLGYYIDAFWLQCAHAGWPVNHTITNHDFIIAHGGLLFDLHVYEDEAPVDDPAQRHGLDLETLQELLGACHEQVPGDGMIHVSGYVPWRYKYTHFANELWNAGGRHHAVWAEWRSTDVISAYNGYLEADALDIAAMTNASFFMHFPLAAHYPQNPMPTPGELRARGILDGTGRVVPRNYYAHYVGDYDSPAWLYWMLPDVWNDAARGTVPLSWAFNPNLCERFPIGMDWTRRTCTANDFFVAGDSGAGYANPRNFSEPRPWSGLPGAMQRWEKHCAHFMQQWDIDVVGFVLDGLAPNMTREGWDAYARFSPGGIVLHHCPDPRGIHNGMPWLRIHGDLPQKDPAAAAHRIMVRFRDEGPNFLVFRSVLQRPSDYVEIENEIRSRARHDSMCVDMRTLLWLFKQSVTKG